MGGALPRCWAGPVPRHRGHTRLTVRPARVDHEHVVALVDVAPAVREHLGGVRAPAVHQPGALSAPARPAVHPVSAPFAVAADARPGESSPCRVSPRCANEFCPPATAARPWRVGPVRGQMVALMTIRGPRGLPPLKCSRAWSTSRSNAIPCSRLNPLLELGVDVHGRPRAAWPTRPMTYCTSKRVDHQRDRDVRAPQRVRGRGRKAARARCDACSAASRTISATRRRDSRPPRMFGNA